MASEQSSDNSDFLGIFSIQRGLPQCYTREDIHMSCGCQRNKNLQQKMKQTSILQSPKLNKKYLCMFGHGHTHWYPKKAQGKWYFQEYKNLPVSNPPKPYILHRQDTYLETVTQKWLSSGKDTCLFHNGYRSSLPYNDASSLIRWEN